MVIEKEQVQQIQTILSKRELDRHERLEFLSAELKREVKSTKELSFVEAGELISFLITGKKNPVNWALFDKDKFVKQRKYLWSLLYQAQWVVENENHIEVPDLMRLSNFIKSPKSPVQKPLKRWNTTEWSKMIFVFEKISKGTFK
jgi:hypothetical protein